MSNNTNNNQYDNTYYDDSDDSILPWNSRFTSNISRLCPF